MWATHDIPKIKSEPFAADSIHIAEMRGADPVIMFEMSVVRFPVFVPHL
jgi:hypothetical protein